MKLKDLGPVQVNSQNKLEQVKQTEESQKETIPELSEQYFDRSPVSFIETAPIEDLLTFRKDLNELASCTTDNFELMQQKLNLLVTDINLKYDTLTPELDALTRTTDTHTRQFQLLQNQMNKALNDFDNSIETTQQNLINYMASTDTNFLSHDEAIEKLQKESKTLNHQNLIQFVLLLIMLILSLVNLFL